MRGEGEAAYWGLQKIQAVVKELIKQEVLWAVADKDPRCWAPTKWP